MSVVAPPKAGPAMMRMKLRLNTTHPAFLVAALVKAFPRERRGWHLRQLLRTLRDRVEHGVEFFHRHLPLRLRAGCNCVPQQPLCILLQRHALRLSFCRKPLHAFRVKFNLDRHSLGSPYAAIILPSWQMSRVLRGACPRKMRSSSLCKVESSTLLRYELSFSRAPLHRPQIGRAS